jgi:hypothetical protein
VRFRRLFVCIIFSLFILCELNLINKELKMSLTAANIPMNSQLPETNHIKFIARALSLGYRTFVSLK